MLIRRTTIRILFLVVLMGISSPITSVASSSSVETSSQQQQQTKSLHGRHLQAIDFFDDDNDLCDNASNPLEDRPDLGPCDKSRFPQCGDDEDICYNRKPSRDHFHRDNHEHVYYIQYDRVFCYPISWGGCSSCSPGRYCQSEKRCILHEEDYPCAQWF
jgi:hypothetical protein